MSAYDDLKDHHRAWARFLTNPGELVVPGGGVTEIHMSVVPRRLQDAFKSSVSQVVVAHLHAMHEQEVARLKESAISEARATLDELVAKEVQES